MKTPQIPAMAGMSPLGIAVKHCTYPDCLTRTNAGYMCGRPCPTGNRPVVPLNRIEKDQKTVAERKWRSPLKPKAEQKACDAGLFSDDSKQTEMF